MGAPKHQTPRAFNNTYGKNRKLKLGVSMILFLSLPTKRVSPENSVTLFFYRKIHFQWSQIPAFFPALREATLGSGLRAEVGSFEGGSEVNLKGAY